MNLREHLAEQRQRAIEDLRQRETELLEAVAKLDPNDHSRTASYVREVAQQVRDHRAAGKYTTQG